MGKPKKKSKKRQTGHRISRVQVARRIASLLWSNLGRYQHLEGADHVMFLVINGCGPDSQVMMQFDSTVWAESEVTELMSDAMSTYEAWEDDDEERKAQGTVQAFVEAGIAMCLNIAKMDRRYADTAIMAIHPEGAVWVGYSLIDGRTTDNFRDQIYKTLGMGKKAS